METLKQCVKKYPLVLVFFIFLAVFSLVDTLKPAREESAVENRKLEQAPAFTLESFLDNQWTKGYGEYVKDQLLFRDGWVTTQSHLEAAQGKLEAGGVWLAKNGYQIAKNETLTPAMEQRLAINTSAVQGLAQRYPGKTTVMIVPSPANILSDTLRWNPPQLDENLLLDEMFESFASVGAHVVDLRLAFSEAHREGEQVFFYTDHHWTLSGAQLAYQSLCAQMGLQANRPDAPLVQVPGFHGTNYAKTRWPGSKSDTLEYYDVQQALEVYSYQSDGSLVSEVGPLMDKEKLDEYDKYGAFLRGNNGYSTIKGEGEGSILVIKDSYGNSFIPFLIQNYGQIGIIDLRRWNDVDEVMKFHAYDQILVLYCFNSFATDMNAYRMG